MLSYSKHTQACRFQFIFFQGKFDIHTVTDVAKDYYDAVVAPHKEYISFDNLAR